MRLKQLAQLAASAVVLSLCATPLKTLAQVTVLPKSDLTRVADTAISINPATQTRLPFFWEDTSIRGNNVVWVSPGVGEAFIDGEYGGLFRATLGTRGSNGLPVLSAIVTTTTTRNPSSNRLFTFYGDHLTAGNSEVFQANDDDSGSQANDPLTGRGQTTGFYLAPLTGTNSPRIIADSNTRFPDGNFYSLNNFNGAFGFDGTTIVFAANRRGVTNPRINYDRDAIFARNIVTGGFNIVANQSTTNPSDPTGRYDGFLASSRVSGQNVVFLAQGPSVNPSGFFGLGGIQSLALQRGRVNGGPISAIADTYRYNSSPYRFPARFPAENRRGPIGFIDFGANPTFRQGRRIGFASVRGNQVVFSATSSYRDYFDYSFGRGIYTATLSGSSQNQNRSVRTLIDDTYQLPGGRYFISFGDVSFNENGTYAAFEASTSTNPNGFVSANDTIGLYVINVQTRRLVRVIQEGDVIENRTVIDRTNEGIGVDLPAIAFGDNVLTGGFSGRPLRAAFRLTFGQIGTASFQQRLYAAEIPTN